VAITKSLNSADRRSAKSPDFQPLGMW